MDKNQPAEARVLTRAQRHRKKKTKKNKGRAWLIALGVVLVLGLGGFIFRKELMVLAFDTFLADTVKNTLDDSFVPLDQPPKGGGAEELTVAELTKEPFSVLLLGTDQRDDELARTDSIIYSVVRPVDNKVLLISIPRDSYVDMVGTPTIKGTRSKTKINAAYAYGGAQMSVDTVEALLDHDVDYYATINFNGLKDVVNALGGVELPITETIENKQADHEKFTIEANKPIYDGTEALNYVRYREDSDFKRTERHRIFLKQVLDRLKSVENLTQIPKLIGIAGQNFKTNMNSEFMLSLAKTVILNDSTPTISSHMLQGEGVSRDAWYYELDDEDLEETIESINKWLDPNSAPADLIVDDTDEGGDSHTDQEGQPAGDVGQ
ncbi:LCP family protein [Saccharibacillus brassicae]|uniref:LytR family transcriptional regulator n=1 Tax=Saccharibacillus brassicae TaxID=2583377 RepID=A0A4Y6UQY7_SACBS|nr:LCP family protein [Saccharibacillus brassicae]QDH20052.1 LytR family transcriptional regulator [Saccharibacillus brassicae]